MLIVQKINYTNKMGKIRQIKIELIIFTMTLSISKNLSQTC